MTSFNPLRARLYRTRRTFDAFGYVFTAGAGASAFAKTSPFVYTSGAPTLIWALFFIFGGMVSLIGVVTGFRLFEAIGIPMSVVAVLVYVVALLDAHVRLGAQSTSNYVFPALLFVSFAAVMCDRLIVTYNVIHSTREVVVTRGREAGAEREERDGTGW